MQTAGMLRGTGAMRRIHVLVIGTLILAYIGENAHALPLQLLPNIPGYIPVYIRHGDQPLDEINPALAEAFHEKQTLESIPEPERLDNSSDDLGENLENHPSYDDGETEDDDDGGLNAGDRRKETIYLIGLGQTTDDKTRNNGDAGPKIALPFEVLEREEAFEGNSADNRDNEKSKDVWIEEPGKQSNARKPIGLTEEAVIKVSGLPLDVEDLEKLAAEVEKEETRPNDFYDGAIVDDRRVSSSQRQDAKIPNGEETTKERENSEGTFDDTEIANDRRVRPNEDPREFRSSRSRSRERILRPARDPKESRPDDDSTDFMIQEE